MDQGKILITEDEESLRMTLGVRLRSEGYDVDTASGGIEGFKKATSRSYDLIILDILLPERIVVAMPPDSPEWLAVRDRLHRAAAPVTERPAS